MLTSPAWLTSRSSSGARTRTAAVLAAGSLGRRQRARRGAAREAAPVDAAAAPRPAACGAGSGACASASAGAAAAGSGQLLPAAALSGAGAATGRRHLRAPASHATAALRRDGAAVSSTRPAAAARTLLVMASHARQQRFDVGRRSPGRCASRCSIGGFQAVRHLAQAHRAGQARTALERVQRAHAGRGGRAPRRAGAPSRACALQLRQQFLAFFLEDREQLGVDRVDGVDVVLVVAARRRAPGRAAPAQLRQLGKARSAPAGPSSVAEHRVQRRLDPALRRLGRRSIAASASSAARMRLGRSATTSAIRPARAAGAGSAAIGSARPARSSASSCCFAGAASAAPGTRRRKPAANWCSRRRISSAASMNSCASPGVARPIAIERISACSSARASCDRSAKPTVAELPASECASATVLSPSGRSQLHRPLGQLGAQAARQLVGLVQVDVEQRNADAQVADDLDLLVVRQRRGLASSSACGSVCRSSGSGAVDRARLRGLRSSASTGRCRCRRTRLPAASAPARRPAARRGVLGLELQVVGHGSTAARHRGVPEAASDSASLSAIGAMSRDGAAPASRATGRAGSRPRQARPAGPGPARRPRPRLRPAGRATAAAAARLAPSRRIVAIARSSSTSNPACGGVRAAVRRCRIESQVEVELQVGGAGQFGHTLAAARPWPRPAAAARSAPAGAASSSGGRAARRHGPTARRRRSRCARPAGDGLDPVAEVAQRVGGEGSEVAVQARAVRPGACCRAARRPRRPRRSPSARPCASCP